MCPHVSSVSVSWWRLRFFSHTHTDIYACWGGRHWPWVTWRGSSNLSSSPRCSALVILAVLQPHTHTNTLADTCMRTHILTGSEHPHQSQFWAGARCPFSLSHLNRLIRPYLAFLLTLLSHDCCHRKKCAETQRLTPNVAHSIALFLFSIHSANAIFALFLMCFFPPFFYQPTFFFCCL